VDYPKHMFKSPGSFGSGDKTYAVRGAADEDEELRLLELGWCATKEEAFTLSVLDHDGNGKAGGSLKQPEEDVKALRVEYQSLADKKPFPGWSAELLREKIAALKEE
jgi:hypothetical protein